MATPLGFFRAHRLLEKNEFEYSSIEETLACLAWFKEKTIFSKSIAAIIMSNINPEKCGDKYDEMLREMNPSLEEERAKRHACNEEFVKSIRGKRIDVRVLDAY